MLSKTVEVTGGWSINSAKLFSPFNINLEIWKNFRPEKIRTKRVSKSKLIWCLFDARL